jgi:hypothetical protein
MASADDGEGSGLRVDRFPGGSVPEALDPTAPNAVTQLVPIVPTPPVPGPRRAASEPVEHDPPLSEAGDTAVIRAVARRPATPLPALGGADGPRDAPQSAGRRRQASGRGPDDTPPPPTVMAAMAPAETTGPTPSTVTPPVPVPPVPGPPGPARSAGPLPARPVGATVPRPRQPESDTSSSGTGSTDTGSSGTGTGSPGLWHLPTAPQPITRPPATGDASPADPTGIAAGAPEGPPSGELVDPRAELPARHLRPEPATFVEPRAISAGNDITSTLPLVVVDHPPFMADDWLPVDQVTIIPEPVRTLPGKLGTPDSWEAAPDADPTNADYLGRRRSTALSPRILVVIALVLLGLGAAIGIPLVVGDPGPPTAGPGVDGDNFASDGVPVNNGGELISAASSPGASPTRNATSPAAGGAPIGSSATPASSASSTPPPTTAPPAGFQPLTLNAVAQRAHPQDWGWQLSSSSIPGCSPAQVILTGRWSTQMVGTLTFANINVPASGGYFMTVKFNDGDGPRSEDIRVNNASINTAGTFPAGCDTRKLPISLNQGSANTISFANQNAKGITVLQIVISST